MAEAAGAGAGAGAGAQAAKPSGESQGTGVKTQQPTVKTVRAPPRRSAHSVLKVSQLLLGAIASHRRLTANVLRKELGSAGYQVSRRCRRCPSRETSRDTLIRVSGTRTSGYFRVWKAPKPKRKRGRPRLQEAARSPRRTPAGPCPPRRRRRVARRLAAKKAREMWRREARTNGILRKLRPRAKDSVRSRAKAMDRGRGRTVRENRLRTRLEKRPREEKKQDAEKPVKRTIQRSASVKTDPRAARTGCR